MPPAAPPAPTDAVADPQTRTTRVLRGLNALMQLTMLAGLVWSAVAGNLLQAVVVALIMAATLSPTWLSRRFGIVLPLEFEVLAILFLYASLFLGEFGRFYHRFWWWDAVLHTSSGFLLGTLAFVLLFTLNGSPRVHLQLAPGFVSLFTFAFAVAAGAVWEIFEFAMDSLFGTDMQKSGLVDTMWDLIVDSVGALVIAVLGYLYLRHGHRSFIFEWVERFVRANPRFFPKRTKG